MALAPERGQRPRAVVRALRLEGIQVEELRLRRIPHVLHNDVEEATRAVVDVVDELDRVLRAPLDVGAARDDAAARLLDQIEIVIVRRRAEGIVPAEENHDLAARSEE